MAEVRMAEAASLLGVSVATVWRRLRKGELQGRRGPDGHWLVTVPDKEEVGASFETPVEPGESTTVEVALLRAELDHTRALVAEVQQHRDALLRQLEAANVERAELRGLLTQTVEQLLGPAERESRTTPGDAWSHRAGPLSRIWLRPQKMAFVAAAVLLVSLVVSVIQTLSLPVIVLSLLTLILIGYLCYLPAMMSDEVARSEHVVEQARQRLQQFLAVAAHDLEQPLNVVLSYARLLRHRLEGDDDDSASRAVRSIEEAATKMQRLIGEFQMLARVGNDGVAAEPINGGLNELARQAAGPSQSGANSHR